MPGTKKAEIDRKYLFKLHSLRSQFGMMEYWNPTAWRGIKAANNEGMFIIVFYYYNQIKSFVVY